MLKEITFRFWGCILTTLLLVGAFANQTVVAQKGKPPGGKNDPSRLGSWSPPVTWADVAIHLHLLPNGNILTWADDDNHDYHINGSRQADFSKAYVLNMGTSSNPYFQAINNESTNLFCSGHAFLPDGRLLIMGGHEGRDGEGSTDSNIFDFRAGSLGSWVRSSSMSSGRWYPSALTLSTGEVLTVAGTGTGNPSVPEVYQANGAWRPLTTAQFGLPYYPFLHAAPNGNVFLAGPNRETFYLNTAGTGEWRHIGNRNSGFRDYGTSVMYDVGKVLVIGGGDPPLRSAEVIDLNSPTPVWRNVAPMAYARRQLNATILPDGKILVTGGTSGGGFNNVQGSVFAAEMWDPATEKWTTLAPMQVPRLYHSTAILLPDGRVLSAGGGRPAATGEDPNTEHRDGEFYAPPYLFKGPRPTITSAPTGAGYNQTIFVETPNASSITKVSLISLSTATHSFNMGQRINFLNFSQTGGGLRITMPPNPNVCPPGYYMLFILNSNGVPSVARMIQIL